MVRKVISDQHLDELIGDCAAVDEKIVDTLKWAKTFGYTTKVKVGGKRRKTS